MEDQDTVLQSKRYVNNIFVNRSEQKNTIHDKNENFRKKPAVYVRTKVYWGEPERAQVEFCPHVYIYVCIYICGGPWYVRLTESMYKILFLRIMHYVSTVKN